MIEAVIARVPASLATFGCRIAAGPGGAGVRPLSTLRDGAVFDAVIDGFGAPYGSADRRAVVSLWTQSYLAALLIPSVTALLCLGRGLPVGFERVGFELDAGGVLARFLLPDDAGEPNPSLAALIDGHLRPFVELCHAHSGLSRRVVWGNAGVIVDLVLRELGTGADLRPGPLAEAEVCLGRQRGHAVGRCPLAQVFHASGPSDARRRRVCCMRYRLPGVASCGPSCPVDHLKAPC
ncbi:siderophore-iron reductase FhuF [uncultured Methylobacterium sp.]|uniref:siderophore-iron reductase FhuF n=1 Tax=uncultured Methylobacterium sp. TaxID=157278 RepID=UPI0035CB7B23